MARWDPRPPPNPPVPGNIETAQVTKCAVLVQFDLGLSRLVGAAPFQGDLTIRENMMKSQGSEEDRNYKDERD